MPILSDAKPDAPDRRAKPRSAVARAVRFVRDLGPMSLLAAWAVVMPAVGALVLYGRLGVVAAWLRDHLVLGPILCATVFGLAGGLALVPTYALSALCGWSFGTGIGLAASLGGFLLAALLGYGIGRLTDRGHTAAVLDARPKWRAVRLAMVKGGLGNEVLVVTLLRLAPVAPFSMMNIGMAAAQVRPLPFALGTVLGMAPRTTVVVWAASQLSSVDAPLAQAPWVYAGGVVATLIAVMGLGWIGKRALAHVAPVPSP